MKVRTPNCYQLFSMNLRPINSFRKQSEKSSVKGKNNLGIETTIIETEDIKTISGREKAQEKDHEQEIKNTKEIIEIRIHNKEIEILHLPLEKRTIVSSVKMEI